MKKVVKAQLKVALSDAVYDLQERAFTLGQCGEAIAGELDKVVYQHSIAMISAWAETLQGFLDVLNSPGIVVTEEALASVAVMLAKAESEVRTYSLVAHEIIGKALPCEEERA